MGPKQTMVNEMATGPLRLGISRCLLGDPVRYDGGHKRDHFLTDIWGHSFQWVPVCPEVEAGLGTPREPMKLVGNSRDPRLITVETGQDKTTMLERFSAQRVEELNDLDLSGFVFKARSPSCGIEAVPLYDRKEKVNRKGAGLFANRFMARFPLVPIEEEDRLLDEEQRAHFLERVYCYRRWCEFLRSPLTKPGLMHFHATHKYLLMAHSPVQTQRLGSLVARAQISRSNDIASRYGIGFTNTLRIRTSLPKHANVLQHLFGYFRKQLAQPEREKIQCLIEAFRKGQVPLAAPLTAIKDWVQRTELTYLSEQVYFEPYPSRLNHTSTDSRKEKGI